MVFVPVFLLFGCIGVSQDEYDGLSQANEQLESEKEDLNVEISELQGQVDDLTLSKTTAESKLTDAKNKLDFHKWLTEEVFVDNSEISGLMIISEGALKVTALDNPAITNDWETLIECWEIQDDEEEDICGASSFTDTVFSEAMNDIDSALEELQTE